MRINYSYILTRYETNTIQERELVIALSDLYAYVSYTVLVVIYILLQDKVFVN